MFTLVSLILIKTEVRINEKSKTYYTPVFNLMYVQISNDNLCVYMII